MGQDGTGTTRRDLLRGAGAGTVAATISSDLLASPASARASATAPTSQPAPAGAYNILFILTDQERYFRPGELPPGYQLPARERLARQGIVFENHRINSCVCTPSRSVLYTGQHIQQTRMFDNTNFPWIESLSTEMRTVGDLLREAGYYTAYKGKWHLTKEFETGNTLAAPTTIFTKEMEAYGFSDYFGIGDIIAHTNGGYLHDGMITASATSWLRGKAAELAAQGQALVPGREPREPARHHVLQYRPPGPAGPGKGGHHPYRPRPGPRSLCEAMAVQVARILFGAVRRSGPPACSRRVP